MFFFFQSEDGRRDLVRSRGLGDGYKSQPLRVAEADVEDPLVAQAVTGRERSTRRIAVLHQFCLFYTSDAADQRSSVDLGGRRIL